MGKRAAEGDANKATTKKPKYNYSKIQTHLEPNTRGIYVSCDRGKEFRAKQEILDLFEDKYEELLAQNVFKPLESNGKEDEEEEKEKDGDGEEKELDFEEQMKREMSDLSKKSKQDVKRGSLFQFIELQMECMLFVKVHRTIDPLVLTLAVLEDAEKNNVKRTRYISKLIPIVDSCSATEENFASLLTSVFNKQKEEHKNDEGKVYSVDITRRLFKVIERDDIMRIATGKLRELDPEITINYKEYDKHLIIQCFKANMGISIVNKSDWQKYKKFNLTQIFENKKVIND